jgi:hypothetical protein
VSARRGAVAGGAKPLTAEVINAADRIEETPGLPGKLPAGERILWQGRPCWKLLALRALHIRGLAVYFAVIVAWCAWSSLRGGAPLAHVALTTAELIGVSCVPLLAILGYCWGTTQASMYTVTTKRVVMKIGLVVPMSVNIPFRWIESAGLNARADGTGDIILALGPKDKLAWFVLWPHAQPWRMAKAVPMLRGLRDARGAAQVLARALATFAAGQLAQPAVSGDDGASNGGSPAAAVAA